jgi:hypothetical protein
MLRPRKKKTRSDYDRVPKERNVGKTTIREESWLGILKEYSNA